MKPELTEVLRDASTVVLETMFFADVSTVAVTEAVHDDPLACSLVCSGAENGSFTVAVDRAALEVLSESFYGDDGEASTSRETELLCELTNMLAGSTLSAYAPDHYCPLSSPRVCDFSQHLATASAAAPDEEKTSISLALDGGLLSVSCVLKAAA